MGHRAPVGPVCLLNDLRIWSGGPSPVRGPQSEASGGCRGGGWAGLGACGSRALPGRSRKQGT